MATEVVRLNGANFLSLARGKAVIFLDYRVDVAFVEGKCRYLTSLSGVN